MALEFVEFTLNAVGFEIVLECADVTKPLQYVLATVTERQAKRGRRPSAIIGAPVPESPRLVAALIERPDNGTYVDRWRAAFELLLEAGELPEEGESAS